MQALYWDGQHLDFTENYPAPDPSSGAAGSAETSRSQQNSTALVRVHLAGICSTDLQIFKGYMGFTGVPGHEFVGTVADGPAELCGKRVVGEINFACGQCEYCRRGLSRHCPRRRVMGIRNADGAFAEFVAIPVGNLHLVPDSGIRQGSGFHRAFWLQPSKYSSRFEFSVRRGSGIGGR